MQTNEQLYQSLKGDLLNLLIAVHKDLNPAQGIRGLEALFTEHFNITQFEFFLYADNRFRIGLAGGSAREAEQLTEFEVLAAPAVTGLQHPDGGAMDFADDTMMIRNAKREPVAMILVKSTAVWDAFSTSPYFKDFQFLLGEWIDLIKNSRAIRSQSENYLRLLQATKQFNSTMSMTVICDQLVDTVADHMSPFSVELIVSHEEHTNSSRYRLFDYANEKAATIGAFLSGELRISRDEERKTVCLTAPVKGMQGTYGVLEITAPKDAVFSDARQEFVRSICESAGHAIENSSLYSQSHRLIRDLQLVNEVSKKLTGRLTFEEMKTYIADQLGAAFEPEEMAFVYYDRNKEGIPALLDTTTPYFHTRAGRRYLEYAEKRLQKERDAVFVADLTSDDIDGFSSYRSLIVAPIVISDTIAGYALLMHSEKYYFSFDDFKLVKAILSHSSLAMSNLMLREKLQDLANKDQLTGLYARGYLDRHMSESFKNGVGGAFILLDVDDFKQVNDRYGHAIGDKVLIQTAHVLRSAVREHEIAGRWGGEEFAVFLPGAGIEEGRDVARQLLEEMPSATEPSITVSIGVSVWEPSANRETYQQLFQNTDEALYEAKTSGKNRIIFSESILAD